MTLFGILTTYGTINTITFARKLQERFAREIAKSHRLTKEKLLAIIALASVEAMLRAGLRARPPFMRRPCAPVTLRS